jgi:hypothetical protein
LTTEPAGRNRALRLAEALPAAKRWGGPEGTASPGDGVAPELAELVGIGGGGGGMNGGGVNVGGDDANAADTADAGIIELAKAATQEGFENEGGACRP